jgi:hypothetical protein
MSNHFRKIPLIQGTSNKIVTTIMDNPEPSQLLNNIWKVQRLLNHMIHGYEAIYFVSCRVQAIGTRNGEHPITNNYRMVI